MSKLIDEVVRQVMSCIPPHVPTSPEVIRDILAPLGEAEEQAAEAVVAEHQRRVGNEVAAEIAKLMESVNKSTQRQADLDDMTEQRDTLKAELAEAKAKPHRDCDLCDEPPWGPERRKPEGLPPSDEGLAKIMHDQICACPRYVDIDPDWCRLRPNLKQYWIDCAAAVLAEHRRRILEATAEKPYWALLRKAWQACDPEAVYSDKPSLAEQDAYKAMVNALLDRLDAEGKLVDPGELAKLTRRIMRLREQRDDLQRKLDVIKGSNAEHCEEAQRERQEALKLREQRDRSWQAWHALRAKAVEQHLVITDAMCLTIDVGDYKQFQEVTRPKPEDKTDTQEIM